MANSSRRDDVENVAHGNAPGESGGKVGIIGAVLVLFMLLGLINLGSFWFGPLFSQSGPRSGLIGQFLSNPGRVSVDSRIRSGIWPEFRSEAKSYLNRDLLLTSWALGEYMPWRDKLRNLAPFGDYVMVRVLRFLGLFSYLLGGLFVVGLFVAEGFKRNTEKRLDFKRFSSTSYHLVLKTGVVSISGLFIFYLFIPNEIHIPSFVKISVPSIFYNPSLWALLATAAISYTVFVVISNLSTKV